MRPKLLRQQEKIADRDLAFLCQHPGIVQYAKGLLRSQARDRAPEGRRQRGIVARSVIPQFAAIRAYPTNISGSRQSDLLVAFLHHNILPVHTILILVRDSQWNHPGTGVRRRRAGIREKTSLLDMYRAEVAVRRRDRHHRKPRVCEPGVGDLRDRLP